MDTSKNSSDVPAAGTGNFNCIAVLYFLKKEDEIFTLESKQKVLITQEIENGIIYVRS